MPRRLPGPRPAPLRAPGAGSGAGPIRHGAAGGAGRRRGGGFALAVAGSRRRAPVVGCAGCRSRRGGGGRGGAGAGGGWPEVTRRGGAAWPRLWCSGDLRAGGAGTGGCVPPARRWVRTCPSPRLERLERLGSDRRAVVAGRGKAGPFQGLGRVALLPRCPWRPRALRARRARCSGRPRAWQAPEPPRRAAPPPRDPPGKRWGGHRRQGALPRSGSRCRVIWGRACASEWLSSISVFTHLLKIACLEIIGAHKRFLWQQ